MATVTTIFLPDPTCYAASNLWLDIATGWKCNTYYPPFASRPTEILPPLVCVNAELGHPGNGNFDDLFHQYNWVTTGATIYSNTAYSDCPEGMTGAQTVIRDIYDFTPVGTTQTPIPSIIDGTTYPVTYSTSYALCKAASVKQLSGQKVTMTVPIGQSSSTTTEVEWDYENDFIVATGADIYKRLYPNPKAGTTRMCFGDHAGCESRTKPYLPTPTYAPYDPYIPPPSPAVARFTPAQSCLPESSKLWLSTVVSGTGKGTTTATVTATGATDGGAAVTSAPSSAAAAAVALARGGDVQAGLSVAVVVVTVIHVAIGAFLMLEAVDDDVESSVCFTVAVPVVPVLFEDDPLSTPDHKTTASANATYEYWVSFMPIGNGFMAVNHDDKHILPPPMVDGDEFYSIAVFHQLHCLYSIMKMWNKVNDDLDQAKRGRFMNRDGTEEEVHHPDLKRHMDHCFRYLRQTIVCCGDTALEGQNPKAKIPDTDGTGATHLCKDFEKLKAWAEERRLNEGHSI
ncbi:hypothetical protein VTG60DRAFT_2442 [Thermothelomyces hinnuleus]